MTTEATQTREKESWAEVERCVDAFRAVMLEKLKKNQHKGNREGWNGDSPFRLLARIREEAIELEAELRNLVDAPLEKDAEVRARVVREAADVANMAMMVADAAGALDVPSTPARDEAPTEIAHDEHEIGAFTFGCRKCFWLMHDAFTHHVAKCPGAEASAARSAAEKMRETCADAAWTNEPDGRIAEIIRSLPLPVSEQP